MATTHGIDTGGRAPALEARGLTVHYGQKRAVHDVSLVVPTNQVVALIGPSGCGKSTLLRCFNRMNDLIPSARITGEALFRGQDLYDDAVDPVEVRRRIGMVFQKPNPFPRSIFQNVAWGPTINGMALR
ncbi:MAG TPA: ATP-binding cassette domain-containing protein, partial [Longimicrobiales bacterium]